MRDRKRIAVLVLGDGIGDAVMRLPFLYALRQAYPNHEVWWIASLNTVMATVMGPLTASVIDRVLTDQLLEKPARQTASRYRALPEFDMVFDVRARWGTVLAARTFMRYQKFFCCLPAYVFSDGRPPTRWQRPLALPERMLSMLEASLGRPAEHQQWKTLLTPGQTAKAMALKVLPAASRPYVGLAIGSNNPVKNWLTQNFVALAKTLRSLHATPVFITGPSERDLLQPFEQIEGAIYYDPQHYPDIDGLELTLAIGERLSAFVGNDSGISHLMTATDTPIVALFGPTRSEKCGPWTTNVTVVKAQEFGGSLMDAIPVERVVSAIERILCLSIAEPAVGLAEAG